MLLLAYLVAVGAATLLIVEPSGRALDNQPGLQLSPDSTQISEGALRGGYYDCNRNDSQGGTCWLDDPDGRTESFMRSCGRKGKMYNFQANPASEGRCYCYRCQ